MSAAFSRDWKPWRRSMAGPPVPPRWCSASRWHASPPIMGWPRKRAGLRVPARSGIGAARITGRKSPPTSRSGDALRRLGRARFRLDALDHRAQPVRALRRQVLREAEPLENRRRFGRNDLVGRAIRIKRQRQRDETAHDMRVAVAAEMQDRLALRLAGDFRLEPDLACAALHLVGRIMCLVGQRLERAAELDQIAVAVFPLVQEFEVFKDLVDLHRPYMDRRKPFRKPGAGASAPSWRRHRTESAAFWPPRRRPAARRGSAARRCPLG